ncbi:MAG: DNA repair exonuclease [Eubacterium sp.]|nr:DNA repair exonuclease [Eubacterium sp.]
MKFVHISDVCLGAAPDADKEWGAKRTEEIEETFKSIIQVCLEEDVRLLLISGNLFAAPPTVEDLEKLDDMLSVLTSTRIVVVAGDKDYIEAGSPQETYKFKSKTVILPRERTTNAYLKGINTCVTGYSYGRPEYNDNLLEDISPGREGAINILLACGGTEDHMPFKSEIVARKGFDYIALGGSSKPVHILKNRMAYPGSPEPLSHLDTGRRGYIIGEIEDGVTKIKWKPIAKRQYINMTVDISSEFSDQEIIEGLFKRMRKLGYDNIYTIFLKGIISRDMHLNFKQIKNRFNIYAIVDKTLSRHDENMIYRDNQHNLIGRFIDNINESYEQDEEVRSKAVRYGIEALFK